MTAFKTVLTLGFLAFSLQATATPVKINVHGLQATTGSIFINLFDSAEAWASEKPTQVIQIKNLKGTTASTTVDLRSGSYSFFLFDDVDANGELKRGTFGIPAEPYAFSNNVHIGFSKPSFQKMKFDVTADGAVQDVTLVQP